MINISVSLCKVIYNYAAMKKLLLILALALGLGTTLSAQFRVEAGVNASAVKLSALSNKDKSDLNIGYRVGVAYEIKLLPVVYIAPGLQFRTSGSFDKSTDIKMTNMDLALPVMVGARLPLGLMALSAEVGPYTSYQLAQTTSGKQPIAAADGVSTRVQSEDLGSKKFRYGIAASVALHISKAYLRVGCDYDLNKSYKASETVITRLSDTQAHIKSALINTRGVAYYATLGIRF